MAGTAYIDPSRPDYLKQGTDGLMRPRLWLTDDEIAALPADTVVWRNVNKNVIWSGVFCTKEEAAHVAACNKRDTGGGPGFCQGEPTPITAGELRIPYMEAKLEAFAKSATEGKRAELLADLVRRIEACEEH